MLRGLVRNVSDAGHAANLIPHDVPCGHSGPSGRSAVRWSGIGVAGTRKGTGGKRVRWIGVPCPKLT
jgi:hypothetical protein